MSKSPKIIDLYSGVGGLSLGAVKAGFNLVGAIEYEKRILDSHASNFPNAIHSCQDVSKLNGKTLLSSMHLSNLDLGGLIGGPPCQGFSTIGKRNTADNRNLLFDNFFKLVAQTSPLFFLAENVPGILNDQYLEIRKKANKHVEKNYDLLEPIKISANDLGAATTRTRIFFIGVRKNTSGTENLANNINALKQQNGTIVKTAIEGLPVDISEKWLDHKSSWQEASKLNSPYVNSINQIIDGIGSPEAISKFIKKQQVSGCFGTRHSKEVVQRYARLKPGQQDPISKSVKLNGDGYCPTLRAGTDSTKGSFQAVRPIHFLKPRVISPREAARLQGFPDWFQFHETKWHSFRQIGNSVCPIVAEQVLSTIKKTLSM